MSGFQKVILMGNLGADPEMRYTNDGKAVANLRVATSEKWKDKHTGEKKEQTEWHRCVIFGVSADNAGKYLKKGRTVLIEGRLRTRKWTDKENVERYSTEILVDSWTFAGSDGNKAPQQDDSGWPGSGAGSGWPGADNPSEDGPDDDIPF